MAIQWSLVVFTALTGAGGTLAALMAARLLAGGELKDASVSRMSIVALVLAIVGGIASVTHLAHPERMLAALNHPTSGIFVEAVVVGLLSLSLIVVLAMVAKGMRGQMAFKVVVACMLVIGLAMAFLAGNSYDMASIPAWNTPLLPVGYLCTALASGFAFYEVVALSCGEDGAFACPWIAVAAVLACVAVAAYALASGAAGANSISMALFAVVVVLDAIVCVAGFAMRGRGMSMAVASVSALTAFVAALAFRCLMWTAGVATISFFTVL